MPRKDIKLKYLQRNRHLVCWHVGATLASYGCILMTFRELYNPAFHYRDDEFVAKFKKYIHVQPHIKNPVLCLIARCPATDQQLLSTLPTKELQRFFDFEMHSIQRLPTLLFGQSNFNLQSLHLDSYEILTHEPLYGFMNYI